MERLQVLLVPAHLPPAVFVLLEEVLHLGPVVEQSTDPDPGDEPDSELDPAGPVDAGQERVGLPPVPQLAVGGGRVPVVAGEPPRRRQLGDVLVALGRLYVDAEKIDKAVEMFELGRKADPYDTTWLIELAKALKKSPEFDRAKRIAVLTDLVATDADEFAQRKVLVQRLLETDRFAEAEKAAREALEINLLDADTQELLFKALKGQKKDDEAARVKKLLQD